MYILVQLMRSGCVFVWAAERACVCVCVCVRVCVCEVNGAYKHEWSYNSMETTALFNIHKTRMISCVLCML